MAGEAESAILVSKFEYTDDAALVDEQSLLAPWYIFFSMDIISPDLDSFRAAAVGVVV